MNTGASNILKFVVSTLLFVVFWINGMAQCKTFEITISGDTINCVDMNDLRQGKWVLKVPVIRGEPGYEAEGMYKNGKQEGLWRRYSLQGDLIALENYRWGYKDSIQQYFHMNGGLMEQQSWKAANPEKPTEMVEVYDLNDPKKVFLVEVKIEGNTMKHGIWKYYDPFTGRMEKQENYILNKLDDGSVTANGMIMPAVNESPKAEVQPVIKEKPKPSEVQQYEKTNEGKKKVKLRTGQTSG